LTLAHSPWQTYMEGDQNWVAVSWAKAQKAVYELLEYVLLPDYDLTVIKLIWRGTEKHSFVLFECWRNNRTERLQHRIQLEPLLQCVYPPPEHIHKGFDYKRVIRNMHDMFYWELARTPDWIVCNWHQKQAEWSVLSNLEKETWLGGY
jgi:hypothetical protein